MYREEELTKLRTRIRKRIWIVLAPALLLLAVTGVSVATRFGLQADTVAALHDPAVMARITRCEWITYIAAALAVIWLVFGWDLFISPLRKYAAFLDGILHGPEHEIEGTWAGVSEERSVVDGVVFRAVSLTVPDDKGRDYDRLFYWDAEKPLPSFPVGARAGITFHGKTVKDARLCGSEQAV